MAFYMDGVQYSNKPDSLLAITIEPILALVVPAITTIGLDWVGPDAIWTAAVNLSEHPPLLQPARELQQMGVRHADALFQASFPSEGEWALHDGKKWEENWVKNAFFRMNWSKESMLRHSYLFGGRG
eukprot:785021-Amphidinium_carterae.1